MAFEMVADIRRHREDTKTNNYKVDLAKHKGNKFEISQIKTQDIKVGQIIKLKNDEWVPADCLIIQTGAENGVCYISTETLDGERNLKSKFAAPQF